MIRVVFMRLVQILDFLKTNDLSSFIREVVYLNRKAILIEKNLVEVNNKWIKLQKSNLMFEEINTDTFFEKNYRFPVKNRYFKALYYLKKRYGGHVIVKGNEVIGDIWYSATKKNNKVSVHPDVKRFGFKSAKDHAYSFDQFVVPAQRGKGVADALANYQLWSLREKGYLKAYGYYWADNIPAIWNNKVMNKYVEVKTMRVIGCWLVKIILNKPSSIEI
jgi:hypothetical protein